MEQLLVFVGNNPILVGAFAVVLVALIVTESARLTRAWKELDIGEAILLINRREPMILDVSNSSDYANGHILNAEHMPPSRIEAGNSRLLKSRERPVLVYCKNGQVSPQMATRLTKLGFTDVAVLRGGLAAWVAEKQPVTRGKAARSKSRKDEGKGGKGKGKNKRGGNDANDAS